jgi:hypothetical protein
MRSDSSRESDFTAAIRAMTLRMTITLLTRSEALMTSPHRFDVNHLHAVFLDERAGHGDLFVHLFKKQGPRWLASIVATGESSAPEILLTFVSRRGTLYSDAFLTEKSGTHWR